MQVDQNISFYIYQHGVILKNRSAGASVGKYNVKLEKAKEKKELKKYSQTMGAIGYEIKLDAVWNTAIFDVPVDPELMSN
ncbi:unnamed protein product [Gongylonema pulchrum]|uniref:Arm-DNA-bind_5 domain-containing protein n=1 Tax=Gongylonema pulchrum TaxID=637853 RepID=A0A183E511_9BILA|nr:unnamed protein product [Gongylonema pulchrum]